MKKITLIFTLLLSIVFGWSGYSQYLDEGFETTVPPTGWLDEVGSGADSGNNWAQTTARFNSGANSSFFDDFDADNDRWLISPAMNLAAATTPIFTYFENVNFSGFAGVQDVLVSTNYVGTGDPTLATWTTLNSDIGGEDVWEQRGPFVLPTNATVYIAFHYSGNFTAEWYIDDVLVEEAPTCIAPTDLAVIPSGTDAVLSWTENNAPEETSWNVQYSDTIGFDPNANEGTTVVAANNPFTLTSLTVTTIYEYYVQAACTSTWSGPISWTQIDPPSCSSTPTPTDTEADVPTGTVTFTWDAVTGADTYDLLAGNTAALEFGVIIDDTTATSTDLIVNALNTTLFWQVIPRNAGGEAIGCPIWSFTTRGPQTDDCGTYTSSPAGIITDSAILSDVITASGTGPNIIDDLNIILDINHTFVGDMVITITSPSTTSVIILGGSCGGNDDIDVTFDDEGSAIFCATPVRGVYIPANALSTFNGETFDGNWTITVEDIAGGDDGVLNQWCLVPTLIVPPACLEPTGLTASSITSDSADLEWTENNGVSAWNLKWGATGFDPLTEGTDVNNITSEPHSLSTLTTSTTYDFYVQTICVPADIFNPAVLSDFAGPFTFSTSLVNDNCAGVIDLGTLTSPHSASTVGATNDFGQDCLTNVGAPDVVYSILVPDGFTLDIQQDSNSYDSKHRLAFGASCPGDTLIVCTDDPDTNPETWTNSTGTDQTVYWIQSAFSTASGDYTLSWSLTAPPACPDVTALVADNFIAPNTADMSWTAAAGATGYNWEIQLQGVAQGDAGVIDSGATVDPVVLATTTSLVDGTDYTLYVQTDCGGGTLGNYVSLDFSFVIPATSNCGAYTSSPGTAFDNLTPAQDVIAVTGTSPQVLGDLNVVLDIDHTFLSDMTITLTSPTGTSIIIFDGSCGSNDNMNIMFDDEGVAIVCGSPTIGVAIPENALSGFDGEIFDGNWTLDVVDGFNGDDGVLNQWCLVPTLVAPPACPDATALTADNFVAPNSADMSWTAAAGATGYNWEIQLQGVAQGDAGVIDSGATVDPVVLATTTSLVDGTDYTLYVQTDCGGGTLGNYVSLDFSYLIPPANDTCAGVIDLGTLTSPHSASTVNANNDFGQDCLTNPGAPDVVYSILVPDGFTLDIQQDSNSYDSKHRLAFGASCPGDTLIICTDDPDTNPETWTNNTGTDQTVYWIQSAFSTASGDYTLSWSLTAPPACPDVTTLIADNFVAPNTADMSWSAAAGATGYNWEIQLQGVAQGDAGVIDSGTTVDPVVLATTTSLVDGTDYTLYVQSDCGGGDLGDYISLDFSFILPATSNCGAYTSSPGTAFDDTTAAQDIITVTGTSPLILDDLNVVLDIDHTFLSDMTITLTSPTGTSIIIFDGSCGSNDNMNIMFDDEGVAIVCGSPTIGVAIPENALSGFDGEIFDGNWTLDVVDGFGGDDGVLNQWCLVPTLIDICPGTLTTWTGDSATGSWDNGAPNATTRAVIDGEYITSANGSIDACTLTLTATNGDLTVSASTYVNVINDITNDGIFLVENQGSVVQVNDEATVTGAAVGFDVEITTTVLQDSDRFTYFSSPTDSGNIGTFGGFAAANWIFDATTQEWSYLGDGSFTGVMNVGQGYAVRGGSGTTQTVDFTGPFNNGIITQALSFDVYNNVVGDYPDPAATDDDSNFVGNPYPSAISADDLISNNDISTVYIWTHESLVGTTEANPYVDNDYIECVIGTCTDLNNAGNTPSAYNGFIASGQGFFVTATAATDLTFNNAMRRTTNNDQFRAVDNQKLWLNMTTTQGYGRQIALTFTENGTAGFDTKYEARVFGSNYGLDFYSTNNVNDKLSINDTGLLNDDRTIPLGFIVNSPIIDNATISIKHLENLDNVNVYLIDNLLNVTHDLKAGDYQLQISQTGEVSDRFEIVFTRDALSVDSAIIANDTLVVSNQNETQINVNMTDGSIITNIKAFDTLGKLVIDMKPNATNFMINTNFGQGQVLFFKATLENGQVLSNKFMKL